MKTIVCGVWWNTYKKGMFKSGNSNVTTWGEMKVAIKKWFAHGDYKQKAQMQLSQLMQGNSSISDYIR